ncbi:MAG TPA: isochorismatase family protein [Microbacteriaceae bacterium]|nr:isochorismatase family protein [Microbacteriaceae bacterium]
MSKSNSGPIPFDGSLALGSKPALVLIDLVRAYFEPGAPFYVGSDLALKSTQRLLTVAREATIPVIHTRVSYAEGGVDGGYFFKKVPQLEAFVESSWTGEIMAEVKPQAGEPVISKQYASAFFGTSLSSTLASQGVDTLIITGVSTSGCVRATAVDAVQHGFIPVVVRDAVGDRGVKQHDSNLFDIQAKYGEVISEIDTLKYLKTFLEDNDSLGGERN